MIAVQLLAYPYYPYILTPASDIAAEQVHLPVRYPSP